MNLGVAYLRERNFEAAVSAYHRTLELDSGRAESWAGLACAPEELRPEEAIDCYRNALERDPGHVGAAGSISPPSCGGRLAPSPALW
jgi:tetratricopeptide (TPR) repeat protein